MSAAPDRPEPPRRRVTAAQIASTAAELFASRGFHEVGMREVADALGIRGPSLYHHYGSKEEILYAICLMVSREPVELNLPHLDDAGTPTSRLSALVRAHVVHLAGRRVEHLVGRHELNALTPDHRAAVDGFRRHYHRRVRDVIAAGARSGEFCVPHVGAATLALLDMLNGTSSWYDVNGPLDPAQLGAVYVELGVHGLLRAAPST